MEYHEKLLIVNNTNAHFSLFSFFSVDELEDMLFVYYYDIYSVDRGIPCYC